MSYRINDTMGLVLMMLLGASLVGIGFMSRTPDGMEKIWWAPLGVGIAILATCLIEIGFVATEPREIACPYCSEKIVPKVGMSGHLRLSRLDEDQK